MSLLATMFLALLAGDPAVTMEVIDGRQWWSVHAEDDSLEKVLDQIARRSGRRLEGFDKITKGAIVTIELERRPLDQVLTYVLGQVGLTYEMRSDVLSVSGTEEPTKEDLLTLASATWQRTTTRFPGHAFAPNARLAQGELAELRGDLSIARDHYQTLIENHPEAPEVAEATMRTGLILEQLGLWSEASLQFRALANHEQAHEYRAVARLEIARCSIELGDPQSALHVLTALDSTYPTTDEVEQTGRLLIRARALNALERYMEALRAIDGRELSLDPVARRQAMRIRARALEGIGLPSEAARSWLLYGAEAGGPERALALREAARLALVADDELGVLFACREAERYGLTEELGPYWHAARVRLGLEAGGPVDGDFSTRLQHAEGLLREGLADQAALILDPMFLGRGALDEGDALRLTLAWADCLDQRSSIDQAARLLAEERASFDDPRMRAAIDAGAARLFERHGLFERAIAAYEGNY